MTAPAGTVVFYHYVRDAQGPGIRALTPERFRRQLDELQDRSRIIDYTEFAAALRARQSFTTPVTLLTFDDGVSDHRDVVFPELVRRGLSGVFFLNGPYDGPAATLMNVHKTHLLLDALGADRLQQELTASLRETAGAAGARSSDLYRYDGSAEQAVKHLLNYELPYAVADDLLRDLFARHLGDEAAAARAFYLSPEDVETMAGGGMTFGYHTRSHRVLSRLDEAAQRQELAGGVEIVRGLTGQPAVPFCYPYGHRQTYDARTIGLLEALGYEAAFTTARQPVDPPHVHPFEIPRFDTRDVTAAEPAPATAAGEVPS